MEKFDSHIASVTKWWENDNQLEIVKILTEINDETFDKIKVFIQVLQEIYPNKWDIQLKMKSLIHYYLVVIIHFPEITITNTLKEKHNIYDIFFKFDIIDEFTKEFNIDHLEGTRTKVSYGEMASNYNHSHLPSTNHSKLKFSSFCLGSSEINVLLMLLNQQIEIDINLVRYFIQDIKSYLSWESLEGGPHIKMKNVVNRGLINDLPIIDNHVLHNIVDMMKLKKFYEDLSLDFKSNGQVYIVDDNDYESVLRKSLYQYQNYFCYKDESGNYYGMKSEIENFNFPKEPIIFQGKEIFFTLDQELPDATGELYIHPTIKNYITKFLEYELNKFQLKDRAFII